MLFNQLSRIEVDCFGRLERFFFDLPLSDIEEEEGDEEDNEEEGESEPLLIRLSLEEVAGAEVEREEGEGGDEWIVYFPSASLSSDVWE